MAWLMVRFRNGRTLVEGIRAGKPCNEVVLWDGGRIAHPPDRGGLAEAIVELWLEHTYTAGFYRPADDDVIVDAGANVGIFAIQMARQNSHCRVIALEPFPENFEYLEANVEQAGLKNVTCCEMALGAGFGKGRMQATGSRSLDHVLRFSDSNATEGVPVVPLSGLFDLAGVKEIDFLKVDIEGAEREVFGAASPAVLGRFKHIALEYHDQLVPGTLELLLQVLDRTHQIALRPSKLEGCGILLAARRPAATEKSAETGSLDLQESE